MDRSGDLFYSRRRGGARARLVDLVGWRSASALGRCSCVRPLGRTRTQSPPSGQWPPRRVFDSSHDKKVGIFLFLIWDFLFFFGTPTNLWSALQRNRGTIDFDRRTSKKKATAAERPKSVTACRRACPFPIVGSDRERRFLNPYLGIHGKSTRRDGGIRADLIGARARPCHGPPTIRDTTGTEKNAQARKRVCGRDNIFFFFCRDSASNARQRLADPASAKGLADRLQPATSRRQKELRVRVNPETLCANCGEQGNRIRSRNKFACKLRAIYPHAQFFLWTACSRLQPAYL